jgi:hypothetical protein
MSGNPMFIRAVRGPIILITVGVLFAIDHSGGLPFERTWPAIIIVIGVMKLLERAVAPTYEAAYPTGGQAWNAQGPAWNPQYPGGYQPAPPAPQTPAADSLDENPGGPRP